MNVVTRKFFQNLPAEFSRISMVGMGYIGLPTACMFARSGVEVHGVDIDPRAIEMINSGRAHIEENGLDDVLATVVDEGLLSASLKPEESDAFIIAVPTPNRDDATHSPDMSCVQAAGQSIAPVLKPGNLVILESTSPVGATEMLSAVIAEERPDLKLPHEYGDACDIDMVYCPERIIPGNMLNELVENDKVIGGMTANAARRAAQLYCAFVRGECVLTNARTAEMVKLTENSFRDVNIAFANELSVICDELKLNVWDVIRIANRHPRVSILQPGCGVGGHCIAVDPWFIVSSAPKSAKLIRTARNVNDAKPEWVISKVGEVAQETISGKIVCLGMAYKPDVDDFRESPALKIVKALTALHGNRVIAHDPYAEAMKRDQKDGLNLTAQLPPIGAHDVVVILVGHEDYCDTITPSTGVPLDFCGFFEKNRAALSNTEDRIATGRAAV